MDGSTFTQSPFAVLTFIAAPALLTNSSCVLAMSTINRMLRTRDRMRELFVRSEKPPVDFDHLLPQVDRIERQGLLLLRALHSIYIALASFAGATLVTLLGATLGAFQGALWFRALTLLGLGLGFLGVSGLIFGSVMLFRATQISMLGIRDEAQRIRERNVEGL